MSTVSLIANLIIFLSTLYTLFFYIRARRVVSTHGETDARVRTLRETKNYFMICISYSVLVIVLQFF